MGLTQLTAAGRQSPGRPLAHVRTRLRGWGVEGLGLVINYCKDRPPDAATIAQIAAAGNTYALVDCQGTYSGYDSSMAPGTTVFSGGSGMQTTVAKPNCSNITPPTLIPSPQICVPINPAPGCVTAEQQARVQAYNMAMHDRYNAQIVNCTCKQNAWLNNNASAYGSCDTQYPIPPAPAVPSGFSASIPYYDSSLYATPTPYTGNPADTGWYGTVGVTQPPAPAPNPPTNGAGGASSQPPGTAATQPGTFNIQQITDQLGGDVSVGGMNIPIWALGAGALVLLLVLRK